MQKNRGFTIIELIVVIVVIGILATITIVSYTGIKTRAAAATLKSDVEKVSIQLEKYRADHGAYPATEALANDGEGLSKSSGTTYQYAVDGSYYCVSASSTFAGSTIYHTTSTSGTAKSGECPTHSLSFTAIAAISGATTAIGNILTAGALTPSGATVTYQWQSATTAGGGTYTNIPSATASTYTLIVSDFGKYIKVAATGTGNYTGTQTSAASTVVSDPNWLAVGTQVWAKYNLNVGSRIAGVTNQTNNAVQEKYCYADTESNCTTGGGLYQWDEAMQYVTAEGARGMCPVGSHIPSDNDWKILEVQLGMTQAQADASGYRGTDQGTKLKSGGSSGLNMPLTGERMTDGSFSFPTLTYLWSSTQYSTFPDMAWYRFLSSSETTVLRLQYSKPFGVSVRCLGN